MNFLAGVSGFWGKLAALLAVIAGIFAWGRVRENDGKNKLMADQNKKSMEGAKIAKDRLQSVKASDDNEFVSRMRDSER